MRETRYSVAAALAVAVMCWQGIRLVGSFHAMQNWRHSPADVSGLEAGIANKHRDESRPPAVPMPDTGGVFARYQIEDAEMLLVPDRCGLLMVYDHPKWVTIRVLKKSHADPDRGTVPCKNQRITWESDRLRGTSTTDDQGFCRVLIADRLCYVSVPQHGSRSYLVQLSGSHNVSVVDYFGS